MREMRDMTESMGASLDAIGDNPLVDNPPGSVAVEGAGDLVGVTVAPSTSGLSTRVRAVTVLANNSDYLSWFLDSIGRNMIDTAKQLNAFNPLKIGIMAMAKFIRHPNAWKFLVHQVAECSDESFEQYWPDIVKLVREIDGADLSS